MSNRRDFIITLAAGFAAASGTGMLQSCASSADYERKLLSVWNDPEKHETGNKLSIFRKLIYYATLAPSIYNTQPWQFDINDNYIRLFPDFSRRLIVADPDDRELMISIGCCAENFILAADCLGFRATPRFFPEGMYPAFIGFKMQEKTPGSIDKLIAISSRHTNCLEFNGNKVPLQILNSIIGTIAYNDVCLLVIDDKPSIKEIISIIRKSNEKTINDLDYVREHVKWMRFNDSESESSMDGLTNRTLGMSAKPSWFARFFKTNFMSAKSQSLLDEKNIKSSSALIALLTDGDSRDIRVKAGMALERLLLEFTSYGIKYGFLNMPCRIKEYRDDIQSLLSGGTLIPQVLLRIGYAPDAPLSPRRPLKDVIIQ